MNVTMCVGNTISTHEKNLTIIE